MGKGKVKNNNNKDINDGNEDETNMNKTCSLKCVSCLIC